MDEELGWEPSSPEKFVLEVVIKDGEKELSVERVEIQRTVE